MNEELKRGNSIFFIELEKIEPNPYQPRIEFNTEKLEALADSIKQYGVLQPIVVSRVEEFSEEFGIRAKYQIIAGERRFRASKLAGLKQIPAIIREGEQSDAEKLELAIIENLQREDLNPVDKARAFKKLADDFGLKHIEIAKKMGKSREYVSNAMRILMLPDNMLNGLMTGQISEGHTRSLLMLKDRIVEQLELYKRIVADKLTVRAAEKIARSVATDKIRKKIDLDPEIKQIENHIREKLGTKVTIDQKPIGDGGKLTIEYFSKDDLRKILEVIESKDGSSEENISSENNNILGNEEITHKNFEDIQPTVFKEEIDRIEQFGERKNDDKLVLEDVAPKEDNMEKKRADILNPHENLSKDVNLVDNWGVSSPDLNLNLGVENEGDKSVDTDGLKKIEIKNDFDKTRLDSLKRTDDILKSFGTVVAVDESKKEIQDEINNILEKNFTENKTHEVVETPGADFVPLGAQDTNLPEQSSEDFSSEKNQSQDDNYSDLYSEFLKAKNDIHENIEIADAKKDNNSINLGDVEMSLDSAGNIGVEKKVEDKKENLIGDNNPFKSEDENVQVEFVGGETEGFLADAKKQDTEEEKKDDSNNDTPPEDDIYSFKGFSI